MIVTISIQSHPGEKNSHLRRALTYAFHTAGFDLQIIGADSRPSDGDWATMVATQEQRNFPPKPMSCPIEDLVHKAFPLPFCPIKWTPTAEQPNSLSAPLSLPNLGA